MAFENFFAGITKHPKSRAWQANLAAESTIRSRLIRRVTGDGKTEGVLAAWLWNALAHPDENIRQQWPRRLVWCLPMRVLVEQTVATARELVAKLPEDQRPGVAVLMGGEDMQEWFLQPHRPWILIGTQDMLLSRALNRGYASGRARWPVEFGLLNQDSLWVMDEVQLMDVGLATSAQLQAYRDHDQSKAIKPAYSWWMSATLQPEWLKTVDTASQHGLWTSCFSVASPKERTGGLWEVSKSATTEAIGYKDSKGFADRILEAHAKSTADEYGRITLVVCNTVDRAVATFDAIKKAGGVDDLRLVHSRFRQAERESWREEFLNRSACTEGVDRIIVATQVIEAGVDISATCLVTELAPWPNLVQRFGRCARYGGDGCVVVIDRFVPPKDKKKSSDRDEKSSLPYSPEELSSALAAVNAAKDVGTRALEEFEEQLDDDGRAELYPYEPQHLLMRGEFDELFDTTPDLTGADIDISRFIRTGEERDLQVFWAELDKDEEPRPKRQPQRRELCSVPFLKAQDWLCGEGKKRQAKLSASKRAWFWDFLDGKWKTARRADLLPGRIICVAADSGGYSKELGFAPKSSTAVKIAEQHEITEEPEELANADKRLNSETLSFSQWQTIAFHTDEVVKHTTRLSKAMNLPAELTRVLKLAARWHDLGKAHPAFQGAIKDAADEQRPDRNDLAKAPQSNWRATDSWMYRCPVGLAGDDRFEYRPSYRHELASALAMFTLLRMYQPDHPALLGPWSDVFAQLGSTPADHPAPSGPATAEIQHVLDLSADDFDLLIYLMASHHGKVRVALHASPADQDYVAAEGDTRGLPIRGIRNNDVIPSVAIRADGELQPELPLSLEPAALGLSSATGISWRERCEALIERHSPATLAALEAILRAADVAASRSKVEDPEFGKVTNS